jgi:hypothetical protein
MWQLMDPWRYARRILYYDIHKLINKFCTVFFYLVKASVVQWSEFLSTDQEVRVWFPALPDFLRSGGSGMVSTQPREYNWGDTWKGINSGESSLENREYICEYHLHWPRDTLYPQKLALTSLTCGGRSVGIVWSRTNATEFFSPT